MLSTTMGMPLFWPMAAIFSMSRISSLGLPMLSTKNALVLSLMADSHAGRSLGETYFTKIPSLGKVWVNRLTVPP